MTEVEVEPPSTEVLLDRILTARVTFVSELQLAEGRGSADILALSIRVMRCLMLAQMVDVALL